MPWVFTVVCLVSVGVLLYFEARRPRQRRYPKLAASLAFVAVGFAAGGLDTTFGTIVLVGLGLSLCGDLLLAIDGRGPFVAGLVAFLAAHLAYIAAFAERGLGDGIYLPLIGVTVAAVAIGSWLLPTVPRELKLPVIGYIAAISVMVALAVSTHGLIGDWRIPIGAVAFFVSDITVARDRFAAPDLLNRIVGLPLYYGGQLLLAWAAGG